MPTFTVQSTPNPNSVKITTPAGPFIDDEVASFSSAEEAADHLLGKRLFAVTGVENLLVTPDFLTVTKGESTNWDLLMPKVKSVLEAYFEEQAP